MPVRQVILSVIYGADAGDRAGGKVSSGDINGDGYDDVILGAYSADGPVGNRFSSGEAWIIYGLAAGLGASIDLASPPPDATAIYGADQNDLAGLEVTSGDLNGDSLRGCIISAYYGDGPANTRTDSGEAWILYGSASKLSQSIDLASPPVNSSVIYGADSNDLAAFSIAPGDINGDGYDDLVLGAIGGSGAANTRNSAGEAWILYSSSTGLSPSIDFSAPPENAAVIYGPDAFDNAGSSVTVSDINGDGYGDVIVGIQFGDGLTNTIQDVGEAWVVYSSAERFSPSIDLSHPTAKRSSNLWCRYIRQYRIKYFCR